MADSSASAPAIVASLVDERFCAELGEGSIWDHRCQRLTWLDIMGSRVFRYDPSSREMQEWDLSGTSQFVSSVVPLADASENLVGLTLKDGLAIYDLAANAVVKRPGNPAVQELERFNDGKVDPAGRYWAGTLCRDTAGECVTGGATLYRCDSDGSVKMVLAGATISNGLTWTKDCKTMYYIDTPTRQVDAMDFDAESGEVKNRRACITGFTWEETGFPDGCCIDSEGMLWVARFNGGCAGRYDPHSGKLLAEVRVPPEAGRQVTSVAFGGEGLGDLYLTTAREGMSKEEAQAQGLPLAGCLFCVKQADLAKIGASVGAPVHSWQYSP
mmetsp:Transcript_31249/g.72876  ORF Transcript_31249/g.72876 Transcript_31249/m.72876 type:complete len:328 (+) Transcript_31249:39-1022(+)